jgi:hypothetical protein
MIISIFSVLFIMMLCNRNAKAMAAFFGILLLLVSAGDCQMNRDSPFLGSKLPMTNDQSLMGSGQMSGSTFMISQPFNSQPTSDLVISVDEQNTSCNQVSFLLTLTASPSSSTGYQRAKVRILEDRLGVPTAVAELVLLMPVSGGSLHESISFSSDRPTGGSQANEITVMADPDNELSETDERNNALNVSGICPA